MRLSLKAVLAGSAVSGGLQMSVREGEHAASATMSLSSNMSQDIKIMFASNQNVSLLG